MNLDSEPRVDLEGLKMLTEKSTARTDTFVFFSSRASVWNAKPASLE